CLESVVFALPGRGEDVGCGGETFCESGLGSEGFGICQASSVQQPGVVAAVFLPRSRSTLDIGCREEVLALIQQPVRQVLPLAQQTLQCNLDHQLAAAIVTDQ